MKKFIIITMAIFAITVSANAQVQISSPHPDLDVKVTRCANSSGTVVIDMVLTNFGQDERLEFHACTTAAGITAYDDEGNMYTCNKYKMSAGLISQGLDRCPQFVLPQDVPLKFRVELQNINKDASKFTLIKLPIGSNGTMALKPEKPLQIKNIEWMK